MLPEVAARLPGIPGDGHICIVCISVALSSAERSSHLPHPDLAFIGSSTHPIQSVRPDDGQAAEEDVMRNSEMVESGDTRGTSLSIRETPADADGLPRRLLTTYEVAEFVGCHEETVRRA